MRKKIRCKLVWYYTKEVFSAKTIPRKHQMNMLPCLENVVVGKPSKS